jgi:hypothetical protein
MSKNKEKIKDGFNNLRYGQGNSLPKRQEQSDHQAPLFVRGF